MPSPSDTRIASVGRRLAVAELVLMGIEATLIGAPPLALMHDALNGSDIMSRAGPAALALWLGTIVLLGRSLRPLARARASKMRGDAIAATDAEKVARALSRAPASSGALHAAGWIGGVSAIAALLVRRGTLPLLWGAGAVSVAIVHALAAASARALVLDRLIDRAGRAILPNRDPLRGFAAAYRTRLVQTALALLGMTHAVIWALASVFTDLGPGRVALFATLTLPGLLPPALGWWWLLRRRLAPVERYLDAAVRRPGARGPGRDDPTAVQAFRSAQSLPYALSACQALGLAATAAAVVGAAGRVLAIDPATTARLLASVGLTVLAVALYEMLILRDVLRPLLGQLGARHRLVATEVRSPLPLRTKLLGFFGGVTVFTSGLVLLFALSPARETATLVGSVLLGTALALGLMGLILRDIVSPIHALEERSDEMARGELARPVPPAGEADEIGRLTFAFEEMRRALRDKLRSTESLNVDLEREVQRRTEALEQRNAELHDALAKLRRAQDDLLRGEKLASMGRLVAGIAHEINNPVNAVINTLGPLADVIERIHEAGAGAPAVLEAAGEARQMLAVVERGASRTKAIVQALHNYSRGDEAAVREIDLGRSIDDTLDLLRHRLKSIRIERSVEPEARVAGFAGQIDQVLMNLVTNAAQALGDRGGTIRVGAARQDEAVVITVADDGPGIPADVLPRIFDPFFTTKDVGEGSGLGLSIVHGIVERHGGRIDVESEPGRGTTFRVILPARRDGASGPAPAPEAIV